MPKYFALVGPDSEVKQVIIAEDEEYCNAHPAESFPVNGVTFGPGSKWVETKMDDDAKPYAGIGKEYHEDIDAFIPKKPHDSWVRDAAKKEWKAPVEKPQDGKEHEWDEAGGKWKVDQKETELKEAHDPKREEKK
jgi:hypothetical protein